MSSRPEGPMEVPTQDELWNCLACCCLQYNCYTSDPCRGCIGEHRILCCECHHHFRFVEMTGCVKNISQCFCLDYRCAMPCDEDVPNMIGCCGKLCMGSKHPGYKETA